MAAAPEVVLERPADAMEIASVLARGRPTRPFGGRTKLGWGAPGAAPEIELSTERLDGLLEHNEGDLTAILQAGVRLSEAQKTFAAARQRLALDPPDEGGLATIGGVIATADSGPLRHRYGAIRDLILGVQVALPDGTVARAGSRVIKNVAGYDLAKLMCGAYGTLGVICEVIVRLHPLPSETVTVVGRGGDAGALARATRSLARRPLELEALDVRWDRPHGAVLAQAAGRAAAGTAEAVEAALRDQGLEPEIVQQDHGIWEEQRARQRAKDAAIVRVSFPPAELERVLAAVPSAVARAGAGLGWARIEPDPEELTRLRAALAPAPCVLLDAPEPMRAALDPWGLEGGPELELMTRLKGRFDPDGVCNRGRYVGGL
jgi:glycolate oxidase FAD binding subunit